MINWDTLISSFDDPLTLLQWLIKLVEEQESQKVNNITIEYIDDEYYKIVLNYSDGVQVKSPLISKGEKYTLTLQELQNKIEGSDFISFDINEQGTKLVIALDKTHVDDVVTEDSDNLITSGAVFDAISGITSDSKLVEVTYGVTTYDEITQILSQSKIPYIKYSNTTYYYTTKVSNSYKFGSVEQNYIYYAIVNNNNSWSRSYSGVEIISHKENTISPTSTTNYPSSKAVADYVAQHSGGGWQLLWENASPSSTFAGQQLSIDTTNYENLAIVSIYGTVTLFRKAYIGGGYPSMQYFGIDDSDGVDLYRRKITITNNIAITFDGCYHTFIETIDSVVGIRKIQANNTNIPYKIYGFN